MPGDSPVSWLMFFTLAAAVFIIAGAFIYFLRSQRNRDIAAEALAGDNSRVGATPNGAAPELIGFAVLALAIMALLTTGYAKKSNVETAQTTGPVGQTSPSLPPTNSTQTNAKGPSSGPSNGQTVGTGGLTTGDTGGQTTNQTTGSSPGLATGDYRAGFGDQPKGFQPANPAPDTRVAPTQSDTGIGNNNGSTGQPK
jgi:hypothetical protein